MYTVSVSYIHISLVPRLSAMESWGLGMRVHTHVGSSIPRVQLCSWLFDNGRSDIHCLTYPNQNTDICQALATVTHIRWTKPHHKYPTIKCPLQGCPSLFMYPNQSHLCNMALSRATHIYRTKPRPQISSN